MYNICDNESMIVNFVCDQSDAASATTATNQSVIGTKSHNVIVGTE